MLGSINCDTPISSIIKESDVLDKINVLEDVTNRYSNEIKNGIDSEISSGGLSKSAFHTDNSAPLTNSAENLISSIQVTNAVSTLKSEALSLVKEQRKKEIMALKEKVAEKIEQLKSEYEETINIINEITSRVVPNSNDSKSYILKKDNLNEQIKKYQDKLHTLEGMN